MDKGGEFIGTGTWYLETGELDGETGMATLPRINTCYTSTATGAEVAVNTETGQIKIQRLVAVVDVGRAINPNSSKVKSRAASQWALALHSMKKC